MIASEDFDFHLPTDYIAQTPTSPRDSAKLMLVDRKSGEIQDKIFKNISQILTPNDVLVLNDSKVFPARLIGIKPGGGHAEVLLLRPTSANQWEAMSNGLKPTQIVRFNDQLIGQVVSKDFTSGHITIALKSANKQSSVDDLIQNVGRTPLPPYINSPLSENMLRQEYQTIYANYSGSAAAPTAGLHFTQKLLDSLYNRGIQIERVTLHVGPGTFASLRPEQIASKTLHAEWYQINSETASRLNEAKLSGKRIIAVGTTACRTLESATAGSGSIIPGSDQTTIFIMPGYRFKIVDALITNFHLPQSSLLMLVTAFCSAPNTDHHFASYKASIMAKAYQHAIDNNYRFFSFGDAMLLQ